LADEGLKRVEEEAELKRSKLDALRDDGVVEKVAEQVAKRKRANARAEGRCTT